MKRIKIQLIVLFLAVKFAGMAQAELNIEDVIFYRNFAPHKVGSWISAIAVPDTDDTEYKYTWYVAGRNGGVWKTINMGTTYFPVFDSVGVGSIGAVAVSKSHPEKLWVGTGEAYNARSSHRGKGVFYSPDGGRNWESKGLEDSQHISTLLIHPENPDVVYVASMGSLFSPNKMRGVYKTNDGGKHWENILFIDENTGVIDMIMHPNDPDVLYAATYEKYRYPWHYEAGGQNSRIYKTTDGGKNWIKLSKGLPAGKLGRIGLALCYHHPEILYAVIENLNVKPGVELDENVQMNHLRDPYYDQLIGGEVYRSDNSGHSWYKTNTDGYNVSAKAAYSFNKIMVHPFNPDRISVSSDYMKTSLDGGKTWLGHGKTDRQYFINMFGDIRTMWVNPEDGDHMMIGSDGGLYISWDGGRTMFHHYHLPLGEIYMVEYDNQYPYNIYMGLQDHEAWKSPVNNWSGKVGPEDWSLYGMWDGMYTSIDHQNNRWVYITTQFGGHRRVDQLTGKRYSIEPKAAPNETPYRFPWTPCIQVSAHNSNVLYTGSQYLLRSEDQGEHWLKISDDLTSNDSQKIAGRGHMMYCTITSIAESPLNADVIWVGTDDGKVHLTKDQGKTWTDITHKIDQIGGKSDYWVSRVIASMHDEGTAYVCKSGYRNDDFDPLLFKTTDFGEHWKKISQGISEAPVNVVCEDPINPKLLYAGNDEGVFVSFNQGKSWRILRLNMPIVPVKDLKIHPKELDLIVGTYGRGVYVCDISFLHQLSTEILDKEMHLFDIEQKPVRNYSERAYWGNHKFMGDNQLYTPNEPNGLVIYSYFKHVPEQVPLIHILDQDKRVLHTIKLQRKNGLQKNIWDTKDLEEGKYTIQLKCGEEHMEKNTRLIPEQHWPLMKINTVR